MSDMSSSFLDTHLALRPATEKTAAALAGAALTLALRKADPTAWSSPDSVARKTAASILSHHDLLERPGPGDDMIAPDIPHAPVDLLWVCPCLPQALDALAVMEDTTVMHALRAHPVVARGRPMMMPDGAVVTDASCDVVRAWARRARLDLERASLHAPAREALHDALAPVLPTRATPRGIPPEEMIHTLDVAAARIGLPSAVHAETLYMRAAGLATARTWRFADGDTDRLPGLKIALVVAELARRAGLALPPLELQDALVDIERAHIDLRHAEIVASNGIPDGFDVHGRPAHDHRTITRAAQALLPLLVQNGPETAAHAAAALAQGGPEMSLPGTLADGLAGCPPLDAQGARLLALKRVVAESDATDDVLREVVEQALWPAVRPRLLAPGPGDIVAPDAADHLAAELTQILRQRVPHAAPISIDARIATLLARMVES